jgi:hypothetical protein
VKITRRHVLAAMAAVPAAGALGVGGLAWRWWDRPPGAGLKRLSQDEHDFVVAIAEAWFPGGGEPALSGADADLGAFFDDVLDGMQPATATELKLLLQALDDLTLPTRFAPFRTLSLDDRIEVLGAWMGSDQWLLRNAVQATLVLVGTGYTTHPAVVETLRPWFACGYGR